MSRRFTLRASGDKECEKEFAQLNFMLKSRFESYFYSAILLHFLWGHQLHENKRSYLHPQQVATQRIHHLMQDSETQCCSVNLLYWSSFTAQKHHARHADNLARVIVTPPPLLLCGG